MLLRTGLWTCLLLKPIIVYHDPDEIVLNSGTDVEEYYKIWTIEDYCK